jgi:YfiH family protein
MHERDFEGAGFRLPLIQSKLFGPRFQHGFTTRRGGISDPPFDTLNLGAKWGDRPAAVAENRRRLQAAMGDLEIHFATQVHGAEVIRVAPADAPARTASQRADAVWAPGCGPAVGVYVADCAPILIADVATGACAAVHAGWRGTVAKVLSATLTVMLQAPGARVQDLRVAIGPSIGPCCFEVGAEVTSAVDDAFPDARAAGAIRIGPGRPHVDLWRLNALAAGELGLMEDQIDICGRCTFCEPANFFSYRRQGAIAGQLAGVIRAAATDL